MSFIFLTYCKVAVLLEPSALAERLTDSKDPLSKVNPLIPLPLQLVNSKDIVSLSLQIKLSILGAEY
jgi:hypothetical protein